MSILFGNKKDSTQSPSNDLPNEIKTFIQSLNNEKDRELCTAIYNEVNDHQDIDQKSTNRTLKRYIELFKQGANPNILTKLEAFLREQKEEYQKYHQNYIKIFLPALLQEIIQSKELEKPEKLKTIKEIAGIISDTIKQDNEKEWKMLETKITQLQKLRPEEKAERNAIITKLRISDDLNKIINESHPSAEIQEQSTNPDKEIDNKILSSLNIPKEIREKYSKVMEEMMEKINRRTKISVLGNSLGSREENKNQMQPEQATEDTPPEKQSNTKISTLYL